MSDPSGNGGGGSMMGHIPRKKKLPPPTGTASAAPSGAPGTAVSAPMSSLTGPPIPRRTSFASTSSFSSQPQQQQGWPHKLNHNRKQSLQQERRDSAAAKYGPGGFHHPAPHERQVSNSSGHRPSASSVNSSASGGGVSGGSHKQRLIRRKISETAQHPAGSVSGASSGPRVQIVGDSPLVVKISTKGMDLASSIGQRVAIQATCQPLASAGATSSIADPPSPSYHIRNPKKKRPDYNELEDTDEEDFGMGADNTAVAIKKLSKKGAKEPPSKKLRASSTSAPSTETSPLVATGAESLSAVDFDISTAPGLDAGTGITAGSAAASGVVVDPNAIDAPPPGVLNTLWYSRECFLHVFVLDKICGWKRRNKVRLVDPIDTDKEVGVDRMEATGLRQRALFEPSFWAEPRNRMEVSRIHPTHCPVVLGMIAAKEEEEVKARKKKCQEEGGVYDEAEFRPRCVLKVEEKEEVLLVKWRGRSHLHCSWERASDIQRLDPSNNTARNKIKRYYQTQEMAFGLEWKRVLEEERATAAMIHSAGVSASPTATLASPEEEEPDQSEEFFPSQVLEIERILACDESELNMDVLAKQRARNIQAELEALRKRDEEESLRREDEARSLVARNSAAENRTSNAIKSMIEQLLHRFDEPWDPEDNVRYVVKWKGLPYSEMTWEYWRDIKQDAVDQVEDFWFRQQPPDLEKVRASMLKPHPHIRDFRKLQASPVYGIPKRRPVGTETSADDDEDAFKGFQLRSYQLEGVNWLLFNWWNKRSCILADEMGLGKTIQSAAFLQELQANESAQVRGPFLIVAPLSLVNQWQSELHSWAPGMNVVLYHGSADARDFLVQQEFYYTDQFVPKSMAVKLKKQHVTKFHVLITTYEVILKDIQVISRIKWKVLIVDEAHRLKNPKARLFEELATVPRDYTVLLTGTPIANATEELWALLHFANPAYFKDKDDFLEKFGQMTDADQVNELHAILKPYLLRRVKEDVEKSLPPKEETILEVTLTPIQKTFYKAIYERNTNYLFRGAKPSNAPSLMNVMMELRKCCNHPYLIRGAEERILNEAAAKLSNKLDDEGNPIPVDYIKLFGEQLVKSSGKMVLMEKLLNKLFAGGHKVLIFSQMVRALDLLEELLKMKKYRYERLDGSTSSSSRLSAVDRFNRKSCQRFAMLLSTRAGGLGLNLTAADIVIIFDSDWNPQNDLQAMARAHRIGQTRAVRVYRLLTAKTYEMHMFHSASLKLGLERAVLSQNREQAEESEDKTKKKSDKEAQAKEIDELLKKGAYDVFRDDDDEEAEKFMEKDIDQLLEHSSKKVTYGASATTSLGSGLGSFNKASFVTDTGDGEKDVDLDDPEFWVKAVGFEKPEETPEEVAQMLDDGVKRSRKQVEVYDPYADVKEAERRKQEKLALEKMLEKEEKERARLEKKMKKKEEKDKKRREREEQNKTKQQNEKRTVSTGAADLLGSALDEETDDKKLMAVDTKPKKSKKNDRLRLQRRAENADPVLERLRQAWEVPQRNRATAAALRFGFGRFCKIRYESNLTSLPLQDLELFVRSYFYQLSLQVAVTLLSKLQSGMDGDLFRSMFQEWIGIRCSKELDWICESVYSVMNFHMDVESRRRFLRMPVILAEPSYVEELRRGAAFRALRRVGILTRLNRFVEECLDSILSTLGHEELGKRGCTTSDLSILDLDLKARYVTTEELALAIGSIFGKLRLRAPASWWDRKCDVALIIGSFVHGLGNYEAMRDDTDLPFAEKIRRTAQEDEACKMAMHIFRVAAGSAKKVFGDALDSAKAKAELEVQAAVAAAAKAASKREEDAALLRRGGAEAEAVISNMPETQVENAFEFDGTDSHFVTLPRMQSYLHDSVRKESALNFSRNFLGDSEPMSSQVNCDESSSGEDTAGKIRDHHLLPMPDARVLDHRLVRLLKEIEKLAYDDEASGDDDEEPNHGLWKKSNDVSTNIAVREVALSSFFEGSGIEDTEEFSGIGLGSNQCGTSHRSLNDGSDYGYGSASSDLAQVAYGPDAARFLRAISVPLNFTRYAVSGLVYADNFCVEQVIKWDNLRYYGNERGSHDPNRVKKEVGVDPGMRKKDGTIGQGSEKSPGDTMNDINGKALISENESGNPSLIIDPVDQIPDVFRTDARLRASVCMAVLLYGLPMKAAENAFVDSDLWRELLLQSCSAEEVPRMFDMKRFRESVSVLAPDVEVPDVESLRNYVEDILLPHCLRLCVNGNGPSTRSARGSRGEYETAFGVSLHPEPSRSYPCPLPDPCLSLHEHSLEAVGQANALLRRVRLLRAAQSVCLGNNSSVTSIQTVTRSKIMGALQGMPVWWCPWIHDLALLLQSASGGLFSAIPCRPDHFIFSQQALRQYLYSSFVTDEDVLPLGRHIPAEQLDAWTEQQAQKFPSLFQLERRLAFVCSQVTADKEDDVRYDNLPMFDHGAWPRN